MASMKVVRGPGTGDWYPLGHRKSVVGRGSGVWIQTAGEGQHVSRIHMTIRFDPISQRYLVEDFGSQHGTLVNGRKIKTEVALSSHDLITIGEVTFEFLAEDPPDQGGLAKRRSKAYQIKPTAT